MKIYQIICVMFINFYKQKNKGGVVIMIDDYTGYYAPFYRDTIDMDKQIELLDFEYVGMFYILNQYLTLFETKKQIHERIFHEYASVKKRIMESGKLDEKLIEIIDKIWMLYLEKFNGEI